MLIVFDLSLIVQYNDPDPFAWMAIYGLATISCFIFSERTSSWFFSAFTGAIALVWSLLLFPPLLASPDPLVWKDVFIDAAMKTSTVEYVREIGGLWIVLGWMGVLTICALKSKKAAD